MTRRYRPPSENTCPSSGECWSLDSRHWCSSPSQNVPRLSSLQRVLCAVCWSFSADSWLLDSRAVGSGVAPQFLPFTKSQLTNSQLKRGAVCWGFSAVRVGHWALGSSQWCSSIYLTLQFTKITNSPTHNCAECWEGWTLGSRHWCSSIYLTHQFIKSPITIQFAASAWRRLSSLITSVYMLSNFSGSSA
jgi:hypothetical protein